MKRQNNAVAIVGADPQSKGMKLSLPLAYIKRVTEHEVGTFYVGNKRFVLTKDDNESMKLHNYIQQCINSGLWGVTGQTKTVEDNICRILMQMMFQIAKFNGMMNLRINGSEIPVFSDNAAYKQLDMIDLVTSECIVYTSAVFYFNMQMIRQVLASYNEVPNVTISEEFGEHSRTHTNVFDNTDAGGVSLTNIVTRKLLVLMTIADHMCTHLFDDNLGDICHTEFAQNYYTLHSKLKLVSHGTVSDLLNISDRI
ncbi:MAG: hypothetical protein MUO31_05495 [Thermodesulfovibrionales bacterium]|nr:hypothetical protein [Thermodesulfovibrionales bacterium]